MEGKIVSKDYVASTLSGILRPYWALDHRTFAGFSDFQYYLPTPEELETFLKENPVKDPEATPDEGFDCDDYAYVLKGAACLSARRKWGVQHSMCLGIAWGNFKWRSGFHCCNWVIDAEGNFSWVEPQDSRFHQVADCEYGLTLIIV